MIKRFFFSFVFFVISFPSFGQGDKYMITYREEGFTIFFLQGDSIISVQYLDTIYKQAGIKIGGGYKKWENVENCRAYFPLPEMEDGLYKVELYLGKNASPVSYSGSSYVDKGFYLKCSCGRKSLCTNDYVLKVNREFVDRPYYPALISNPEKNVQSDNPEIVRLAREITRGCRSDYERVLAVHDWAAANIYYDNDALMSGVMVCDALSVLHTKRSVCQGYANLSAALLRSLHIPCAVVSGYALGIGSSDYWDTAALNADSNHAWNFAYPDNKLVIFDSTWDSILEYSRGSYGTDKSGDEISESELNRIRSGRGTSILPARRYFHLTVEGLSIDHRITDVPEP